MGRHQTGHCYITFNLALSPQTLSCSCVIHHQYVALSQLSVLVWCTTLGNDCACAAATSGGAAAPVMVVRRHWSWYSSGGGAPQCLLRERVSSHLFKWKAPIIITQSLDIAFLSTFFFLSHHLLQVEASQLAPFDALFFFMVKSVLDKLVSQYVTYILL